MVCIMLVTQTTFRLFIWRYNLKEQRKSLKHILRPFLCSLSLSCPLVSRKQFLQLHCRYFPHYIRRGEVSDQTLFADKHLSTNHCTEDVASCHMAVERSHRQAGQLRRQLAWNSIRVFAPTFCYVFAQFICFLLRQYDGRCRRFDPLRRKPSNFLGIKKDRSDDWCFEVKDGIITDEKVGGLNCWQMVGISYWNEEDGRKLAEDIPDTFASPGGKEKYWEMSALIMHRDRYKVEIRECYSEDVIEIDTFGELKAIDRSYDV